MAADEIRSAYKEFLAQPTKVNNLLKILGLITADRVDAATYQRGVQAILGILRKCIQEGILFDTSKEGAAAGAVREWVGTFFWSFLDDTLLPRLADPLLRDLSFEAALALMEVQHEAHGNDEAYQFPMEIYMRLFMACLKSGCLSLLKEAVVQYSDLRFYGYRILTRLIKEGAIEPETAFAILSGLTWRFDKDRLVAATREQSEDEEEGSSGVSDGSGMEYSESEQEEAEPEPEFDEELFYLPIREMEGKLPSVATDKGHRHEFTQCWLALFAADLSPGAVKAVLDTLDEQVIPGLTTPTMLLDFLTHAYDTHGWQALGSLWLLMQKHGLDYPDFYPKLYSLLSPQLLHDPAEFGGKHVRLLSMFLLRSTHFPAHFASSFIKRLAELAVYAPPSVAEGVYVPLIYNMLKRHHACQEAMLGSSATDATVYDSARISNEGYPPLYELLTLCRHYYNPLSDKVKSLFVGARHLGRHIDVDAGVYASKENSLYDALIERELSHRWSKVPPMQVSIPKTLFD